MIVMNLADTKLESSEAYSMKQRKNMLSDFKMMRIYCKNMLISQTSLLLQKK